MALNPRLTPLQVWKGSAVEALNKAVSVGVFSGEWITLILSTILNVLLMITWSKSLVRNTDLYYFFVLF